MPNLFAICGLAYGDEGKGATTDALVRQTHARLVVRYNGGPQAAHNVVLPDGRSHTFSQFGAGTLAGASTFLSRYMLVNPVQMLREAAHLQQLGVVDPLERVTVSSEALVVTELHMAVNRISELARRYGSCGMGVGVCRELSLLHGDLVLTVGDLRDRALVKAKLEWTRQRCLEMASEIERPEDQEINQLIEAELLDLRDPHSTDYMMHRYTTWLNHVTIVNPDYDFLDGYEAVVFEGAQGVLLDEFYGELPHNTWTNTTFENAITLVKETGCQDPVHKIGCLRPYFTRHGHGPFITEDEVLTESLPEEHNKHSIYQGSWRCGHFDADLLSKALGYTGGVDSLSISCLDRLLETPATKTYVRGRYFDHGKVRDAHGLLSMALEIGALAQSPVRMAGFGPTFRDRHQIPVSQKVTAQCPNPIAMAIHS